jgi:DNA-binding protein HU-beta
MVKSELIDAVAKKVNFTKKDTEEVISAAIDVITETLAANEKVNLVGFGLFEVRERPARKGVDIRTKEEIQIPKSFVPSFKAGKQLKAAVKDANADK